MLQSFANKESEEVFHGIHSHSLRKKFSAELLKKVERRLDLLNYAESLQSLCMLPLIKEEGCVRDAHGKYSLSVEGSLRIAFRWEKHGAADVELKF